MEVNGQQGGSQQSVDSLLEEDQSQQASQGAANPLASVFFSLVQRLLSTARENSSSGA
ncbi:MAG: hypothetical protein AAF412_04845 [Pseudomonadota bacterium]